MTFGVLHKPVTHIMIISAHLLMQHFLFLHYQNTRHVSGEGKSELSFAPLANNQSDYAFGKFKHFNLFRSDHTEHFIQRASLKMHLFECDDRKNVFIHFDISQIIPQYNVRSRINTTVLW